MIAAGTSGREWAVFTAVLWLAVTLVALGLRPPLPVDETRYLAVAWDMWRDGNYIVPHLHGEPYSHKPPLLFWLMTAGWHVFGVNDWWPRLVATLFGLGSLVLTMRLALALWPGLVRAGALAPVLLFGAIFWTVFGTLTMFDMMLALFTLLVISGLVGAARHGGRGGFVLAGVAIGLGVLAKGPAILLHVLPAALTAPWWVPLLAVAPATFDRRRWYMGVAGAVGLGVVIALAWAIPAGIKGGAEYRAAIFWGQSAERMVDSFAHARPWWWYAAVLPGLVVPWLVWPPLWRAFRRLPDLFGDGGVRLCLIWFATAFVAFSLISGKQLHYLLPEFPALALLAARLLGRVDATDAEIDARPLDRWLPGGLAMALGAAVMAAPRLHLPERAMETVSEIEPIWGSLVLIAGALVVVFPATGLIRQAVRLASVSAFMVIAVHLAAKPLLAKRYDLEAMAGHIAALERDGKEIAYFGKYHGQFDFLGRLNRPISSIGLETGDEEKFLKANPAGVVIAKYDNLPTQAAPLFTHYFRSYIYAAWPAAALIAHPGLGNRR
jgi:4-amino-4-deoxy-L-arabinose transferase-like glycosyltransferase